MKHEHHRRPGKRGPSSFNMQDPQIVFDRMRLKAGEIFLDLGCGAGEYAMLAAKLVGETGSVFALDHWDSTIQSLKPAIAEQALQNVHPLTADITKPLDIADNSIDVCLLATVLHTIQSDPAKEMLFAEIRRVLKPSGRLVIVNVKKEDQPFGPPLELRSSPLETEVFLQRFGYSKIDYFEFEYTYLLQFSVPN